MYFEGEGKHIVDSNFTVTAERKEYPEFDACEWVLWFENCGEADSLIISDINDCDVLFGLKNIQHKSSINRAEAGYPCITAMYGCDGEGYHFDDKGSSLEFNLYDVFVEEDKCKSFKNNSGRSSSGTAPFFDIHTKADGVIAAIGWTGNWRADFERKDDKIQIKTGLQNAEFYLKKGEKLRTTAVLLMEYSGEDKYNKFRRLMKKYVSHKTDCPKSREGLLAFELWGSLPSNEMVKRINELAVHGIKLEDIWIDAGWYGKIEIGPSAFSPGWWEQAGNWNINPYVHPNKLADVRDAANKAGYNLMLWIEPERAGKDTDLPHQHPSWFLKSSKDEYNLLFNYGNKDALEYMCNLLSEHIEALGLSCYRQDFNFDPTPMFLENDEENRVGITEIKHILGMYELWDRLLKKHPHLIIDNCSSGGRRADIETLRRSNLFFRSDYQCLFNENPLVLQCHNAGAQNYLPYNGCTSKTKRDTYAIRSSYSSSWGTACYNAVFQEMNEDDFIWLKKTVDEYRSIRQYFSCDFYNHGSKEFDESSWAIWQYHDNETQSGIVMAFRRCEAPFNSVKIDLKGTEPEKNMFIEI